MKIIKQKSRRLIALGALGLSAVTVLGTVSLAQTAKQGQRVERRGEQRGQQRGDRMQRMAKELNLTAAQKARLQPILENSRQQMKALRSNTSLSPEQKRTRMRAIHEATQTKIRSILTTDQRRKLDEMKRQRKNHKGWNQPGQWKKGVKR
jgi:Spy/CpxP family protein refolding chaperone